MSTAPSPTAAVAANPARRGPLYVATVVLLLVTIALPIIFLPMTATVPWAHAVFHLLGIATCLAGVFIQRTLRRGATRTVKVLSWVLTVLLLGWLVGHIGELVTVFAHGGLDTDEHVFDEPLHTFFANIAVPSWALSVLAAVVLLVTIGIQSLLRRRRRA